MFFLLLLEFPSFFCNNKKSLEKCLRNNNKNQHENKTHNFLLLCCEKGKTAFSECGKTEKVRKIIFPINVN